MKLGFIGLGVMGKPMAKRLLTAPHDFFVYDLERRAVDELVTLGARGCNSPMEVAKKTDMTLLSLPDSAIVAQVVTGNEGVFSGANEGHTIIDLSSVDPESTRRLARKVEKIGIDYMDAPVSGGVDRAETGSLTIMLGARETSVDKVLPVLRRLGKKIYHAGDVGAGDAVKIINNLLLGANMAILAEAVVLGRKMGLGAAIMSEIIGQSSGKSYVFDTRMKKSIMQGNYKPGFSVDLQYKDLGLAISMAREEKMPTPMTNQAILLYETARAKGYGSQDMSAVVKVWEELMDIQVKESQNCKVQF